MDARSLAAAWDTRQRSTAEDWAEWFRAFALATLRESPSPALRCLSALAERVPSLAFDLFDASLYACWEELALTATGEAAESSSALAAALQAAMEAESMPTALLGRLLSAADFCERAGTPLDISWRTLGALAQRGSAWAKALRYRESEWEWAHPSCVAPEVVAIHMALDKREEARGVLHAAREREAAAGRMAGSARGAWGGRGGPRSRLLTMPAELTVAVDADNAHLREQLHDWKEALALYEAREAPGDAAPLDSLGRMRCHAALGEWEAVRRLSDKLAEQRAVLAPGEVAELARLGAAAALDLASHATAGNERHWAALGRHAALLPARSFDGAFSRAVLALHGGDWSGAQGHIDAARGVIDAEVTGLVGESYARAYNGMVRLQRLSELEEVLLNATSPTTLPRARLLELWRGRLGHAAADLSAWRELLPVRALAVPPRHDPHGMIAFAQLCSRNGQHTLAFEALRHAEPRAAASWGDAPDMQPDVWLAYTVAMWESGEGGARDDALSRLRGYLRERGGPLGPADPRSATERCLAASGWVHLGEWTLASAAPAAGEASLLEHFRRAAELDPASCAAWHNLAMVHFEHVRCTCWRSEDELGEHHRHHPDPAATDTEERVVAALECLFRCISLRPSSSPTGHTQQDILTLLTLAFEHGETEGAAAALSRGLADTPAETWLAVVPQVIARLGSESERVRTFVLSLLSTLAERHPQGLVYPLTVAATSPLRAQATGAAHVLAHLRRGRDVLVEQAQLVAAELVRASCLWSEAWIDGLETASKAFYTEGDDAGCVRALLPLHEALERGAQTPAEGAFVREFGGALDAARAELRQWQESGERAHLHSAWALYMGLFRAVSPRQSALTSLDLASVSPRLLGATALELAVPGTYEPQAPLVTISGFRPRLSVIASKQRPRRVMLAGDDGREYSFLLKGREDLRQDERVMQLFGLVNRLLGSTAPLAGPAIRRYAVVPLSPASGLIGWVPSCDTLHQLVRHHRESRGVPLYLEHRIAAQLAPEPKRGGDGGDGGGGLAEGGELRAYNALPLLHRVEVFAAALSRTGGRDLAEALWLRSPSAEWWLERRSSYTRSVGVMCVVGYILGLGDRHLNNMLLDRVSGEVVHIDYGDCFEAAALRPRFPETVPFRLTRMLVTAMGVAGVDGVYRSTCEGAMRALRRHRSSVLAMLEAFLYDPLVHWNLDGAERGSAKRASSRASLDGGEARGGAARGDKVMHAQALRVLRRVKSKLDGSEFGAAPIDVPTQVDRLVHEAQAHTNLAQMWGGWNPFW